MKSISKNERLGAAEVATHIRQMILSDSFRVYERLPSERKLCETYQVSRGTIRNALLRLEREGMVDIRPGSGTYVMFTDALSGRDIIRNARPLELIDARFALEPHICRLAVLHGQTNDFNRLQEHINRMSTNANDPRAFSEADAQFHLELGKCAGNDLLTWVINQINDVRKHEQWAKMRHATLNANVISTYNHQHQLILNALMARDPESAAKLMKNHLETARRSLTLAAKI